MQGYYGWRNYETWNVSLWVQNEESLYNIAKQYDSYDNFVRRMTYLGNAKTPDGVRWDDESIDRDALNGVLSDM
jgi:hypothetical protein